MSHFNRCQGFTLIEVLISMLVISIGILGYSKLFLVSLASSQSSYYKAQTAYLAEDLFERIRTEARNGTTGVSDYVSGLNNVMANCDGGKLISAINNVSQDRSNWLATLGCKVPSAKVTVKSAEGNGNTNLELTITWSDQKASSFFDSNDSSSYMITYVTTIGR